MEEVVKVVSCADLRCVKALVSYNKIETLSFAEKKILIHSPKPTPDLVIKQQCKAHTRNFTRNVYKTHWIAGCSHTNKLYCWCCIFFSEDNNVWNSTGFDDLNNLSGAAKRHSNSQKHMRAMIVFSNFGKPRVDTSLSVQALEAIAKHNSRVDHNRRVFQRLVDVVCHVAQQNLTFRGHSESISSNSTFSELASLLSKYDYVLEKHLQDQQEDQLMPNCSSEQIHNNIIKSVADVLVTRIESELKEANFVAIIVNETPDVGDGQQLCLILRYYIDNNIHDRFMGYIKLTETSTADRAETLSKVIVNLLEKNECTAKLVAQSYEGASIAGFKSTVQENVKKDCPLALNVWCNAYNLTSVVSRLCSQYGKISCFFAGLESLRNFFRNNPKRVAFYDTYCSKRLPDTPDTQWMFMSELVHTVYDQKYQLMALYCELCDNPQDWDGDTIFAAENFENLLKSFSFNFFLTVFHEIFEKTDRLGNILQNIQTYVDLCSKEIKEFQKWLQLQFHSRFQDIYNTTLLTNSAPPTRQSTSCPKTEFNLLFVSIIDTIYGEFHYRCPDIHKLKFTQLLVNEKFDEFRLTFPRSQFTSLFDIFENIFEREALKSELVCLYTSPELKDHSIFELIDFINENGLREALPQLLKLAQLIVTVPVSSPSVERAYSSLQRIHSYLRNTQGQERLSELSLICIEKEMLVELRRSPTFYSNVIRAFLRKDRQFHLEYK